MTETSPIGTVGAFKPEVARLSQEEQQRIAEKQGRPHILLQMRITDDGGKVLPRDGKSFGHLHVRGPHVVKEYYKARPAILRWVCQCCPILSKAAVLQSASHEIRIPVSGI